MAGQSVWRVRPAGGSVGAALVGRRTASAPQRLPARPVAATVANWLAAKKPATARRYGLVVGRHAAEVRQIVEAGRAAEIDALWAMRYMQAVRERRGEDGRHLSTASVNLVASALSSWWGWMQQQGLVSDNPWQHRRTRTPDRTAQRILDRDEVRALLRAAPEGAPRTLILVLYATGARRAELCRDPETERNTGRPTGLRWRDVKSRKDGSAVLTLCGKREKTRLVPISRDVAHEIRMLARHHKPEDYVFTWDRWADPITTWDAWKIVHDAARLAGIRGNVSPHWLRHSYITHMLAQGVPINSVQALAGHARMDTTGIYAGIVTAESSTAYVDGL